MSRAVLLYAKGWQRGLIAVGVVAGGVLLLGAGIATGHVVMAMIGGVLLLATGNVCVQVIRRPPRCGPRGIVRIAICSS